MQAVERSARADAAAQQLTPVPGRRVDRRQRHDPDPARTSPKSMQKVIAGANAIADFPYVFGGGHASFVDNAYDCSGSVSYALAAGGLLSAPETSGELESWGAPGPGPLHHRATPTPATPTCTWTACSTTRPGAAASTRRAGRSAPIDNCRLRRAPLAGAVADGRAMTLRRTRDRPLVPLALDGESVSANNTGIGRDLARVDRRSATCCWPRCGTSCSATRRARKRKKGSSD